MIELKFKKYSPAIILLAVFLVDVINTQLAYYQSTYNYWSFSIKSLLFASLFILSFRTYFRTYLWIILMGIGFIIGQLSLAQFEIDIIKNIGMFINYIYVFVLFFGFTKLINQNNFNFTVWTLLFIFLLVFASIIIGFLFDISQFQTYGQNRFGYRGVLNKSSDTTYFMIMAFLFFEIFKTKFKYIYIYFLLSFICTLITGTKASLLFLVFFLVYKLCSKDFKLHKTQIIISVSSISLLLLSVFIFFKSTLKSTYMIFYRLYENEGIISALTSFRSRKLVKAIEVYSQEWSLINYLFGGKTGYYLNVEFDFADMTIFFGILGASIYLWLYYKILIKLYIYKYSLLIIGLLTVSALSGQFFYNTNIALFFAIISVLVLQINDKSQVFQN
jgi:hypothetical protein